MRIFGRRIEFGLRFAFGIWLFEEGYSLNLFGTYIPICGGREPHEVCESWGFSSYDNNIQFHWGKHYKLYWMPWDWGAAIRWDVMRKDGTLVPVNHDYDEEKWENLSFKDGRHAEIFPFTYILPDGEIQQRKARCYVTEMEWRWRIFGGRRIGPKKVSRTISVSFNEGLGERVGSWKGGTIGCGYEMKPGERVERCLRRMERERYFR